MKTAFGFSALVFAPLLIAFLLLALFLLPAGFLLTVISVFDPTISLSDGVGFNAWVFSPMAAAFVLFLTGMGFHSLYIRGRSRKTVWIAIWLVFSVALFVAAWLGISILTSTVLRTTRRTVSSSGRRALPLCLRWFSNQVWACGFLFHPAFLRGWNRHLPVRKMCDRRSF